jgi:hypothetical protein
MPDEKHARCVDAQCCPPCSEDCPYNNPDAIPYPKRDAATELRELHVSEEVVAELTLHAQTVEYANHQRAAIVRVDWVLGLVVQAIKDAQAALPKWHNPLDTSYIEQLETAMQAAIDDLRRDSRYITPADTANALEAAIAKEAHTP